MEAYDASAGVLVPGFGLGPAVLHPFEHPPLDFGSESYLDVDDDDQVSSLSFGFSSDFTTDFSLGNDAAALQQPSNSSYLKHYPQQQHHHHHHHSQPYNTADMNLPSSHIPPRRSASIHSLTPSRDLIVAAKSPGKSAAAAAATATKSKRVRTGYVQVKKPPFMPPTVEWSVQFQDESRQIASEYVGGLGRYAHLDRQAVAAPRRETSHLEPTLRHQGHLLPHARAAPGPDISVSPRTHLQHHPPPPPPPSYAYPQHSRPEPPRIADYPPRRESETAYLTPQNSAHPHPYGHYEHYASVRDGANRSHAHRDSDASSAASIVPQPTAPPPSYRSSAAANPLAPDGMMTPPPSEKATAGEREYLNSPEEILYMQVFVEEVGVWMDSLDKEKHFSRLIPYHSLKSPMLLNAFLACGVKHLTLVNPAYQDDKALFYYDTATTQLLRSLQNPDRNTGECATTAVVLNVYEIMSEKPAQRMNHIAGARALIRECKWDARSSGIGAACFWLNIGMEVLSCLAFNWQTSWDPDSWGLDMDFAADGASASSGDGFGSEELWVHRILYIVAKIANFRATIPRFQEPSPHDEQIRLGNRLAQWQDLKRLCDKWNNACPRTMHPFGYLYPSQTNSKSAFPNVWLIKRAAIIGRLFYHTAQCLLAQTNPMEPGKASEEMRALQLHHAHQVCGIVAHTKDRGVASVAIRSLAIASAVLTDPREQEEVLDILDKIHAESGWRLGKIHSELKKTWGWPNASASPAVDPRGAPGGGSKFFATTGPPGNPPAMATAAASSQPAGTSSSSSAPMKALVNPLSFADFSLPNHPYQNWYEPPNRSNSYNSQTFL
ncbi:C6 zinc finger domain-containing protein [Colletotrichum karsti]|uniref:C6 zinc finger domain-containing protein n=1 Tax=Colletotrichum karsti TaxID=1095194 RepID=A0A9P6LQZ9_9PEZI|nr:C6 zinc finger domain-containing protein [Colletotrichum karsti]KAF9881507.1 C6 zinc finger domain-containing protein [Colletotrichum karsti]